MSLVIDGFEIDTFTGVIELPKFRVSTFAPTRTAGVGVQLMPKVGPPFTITTTVYDSAANRRAIKNTIDGKKGGIYVVSEHGLNYSLTPYFLKFLIEDVVHESSLVIARVVGYRGGTAVDLGPAAKVVTKWTMRAVPA